MEKQATLRSGFYRMSRKCGKSLTASSCSGLNRAADDKVSTHKQHVFRLTEPGNPNNDLQNLTLG